MRPKKLTLAAFGPFARPVTVDFERFDDDALVLIHGQTGGGKTTLLDGMCFALYGETSGGGRSAREMRSHHAPDTAHTEACFEFSVRGRDYVVKRSFRTAGTKAPKGKQELLVRTPGTEELTTVATKVADIDRHVREILGLDAAQFRQVVVLPQGRFRELLEASSRDREAILETLFDTARFREVEEALRASSSGVREEVLSLERERTMLLDHAGASSVEGLLQRAAEVKAQAEELVGRIGVGRADLATREAALSALRQQKARFEELARLERELARLSREQPEHERRLASLAAGRRAEQVAGVEERRREARLALGDVVKKHVAAVDAAVKSAAAREEARVVMAREQAREGEAAALEKERGGLLAALERARALEEARGALSDAEASQATLARELAAAEEARTEAERALLKAREQLAEQRAKVARGDEVERAVREGERRLALADAFTAAHEDKALVERRLSAALVVEQEAKVALAAADARLGEVERRWLDEVAAHLAAKLSQGDPCPVCGGLEHPAPAHRGASDDGPVTRESVEASRAQVREARAALDEAREQTRAAVTERARADERLSSHPGAGEDREALSRELAKTREELRVVEAARPRMAALEEAVVEREAAFAAALATWAAVGPRLSAADVVAASARAVVAERARGLGGDEARTASLEPRLTDVVARLASLAADRARAEEVLRRTESELTFARAHAAALDEEREARERELFGREQELKDALAAAGFDDEASLSLAMLAEEERAAMEVRVREHEGRALAAQERQAELAAELEGAQLEDPAPLEAEVAHRREALEALHKESGGIEGRAALLAGFYDDVLALEERLAAARRRWGVVGRMAQAALGEHPGRVTFQRWVLGALLDGVLARASERLTLMTRGRYTLHRMSGPVARKRSQGLDLAVLDAYTGRERPVSTLSGGESFLTALALALGLGDAVQARMGGVELEAIFVDEGFGGLDPESMDLALDALLQLKGTGRLVGIISHVTELQERIEARLEVIPTRTGSELSVA